MKFQRILLALFLVLFLAACGQGSGEQPTAVSTPDAGLSPSLAAPTSQVAPPGQEGYPIPGTGATLAASETAAAPSEPAVPSPTLAAETPAPQVADCPPTQADMLGPFYVPGAPQRDRVGEGYLLSGVVRSSSGCAPLPGAQVELWMAGPDGEYADDYRATMIVGENGVYRFESHAPPAYGGRPPHIHLMVTVPGYEILVTQHYPQPGAAGAEMDLVLEREGLSG